jgi:hypothetical protein
VFALQKALQEPIPAPAAPAASGLAGLARRLAARFGRAAAAPDTLQS